MKKLVPLLLLSCSAFAADVTRGNQLDAVIRDSEPVYENKEICARVAEIGQKVVAASGNEHGFPYRFYVLNSPDVTAFSVPGGAVYVTAGLLRHLHSEDELAAILSHEIAHVNMRHMMQTEHSEHSKIFWSRVLVVGAVAAGTFAGAAAQVGAANSFARASSFANPGQAQALAELGQLTTAVVAWGTASGGEALLNAYYQGFKPEYEFAADKAAMEYASKAGYDRAAMVRVLERLSGSKDEIGSGEISQLHSSSKTLAARTAAARGQGATPQQPVQ